MSVLSACMSVHYVWTVPTEVRRHWILWNRWFVSHHVDTDKQFIFLQSQLPGFKIISLSFVHSVPLSILSYKR